MPRAVDTPLDAISRTFRKGPCPLCAHPVSAGEACPRCFAPMEVIQSIESRERPPEFIGVLGPSGVGKTVFLGMLLDLLSRGAGGLHGVSRGTFSLTVQRNLILALERQRFPEKTPNEADRWQWVHCEVTGGKRGPNFDVVTPDVAGEAVAAELSTPGSHPTIRAVIGRCSSLVVLIDLPQVIAQGQGQEMFAMQLVNYLCSVRAPRKKRRKVGIPVSFVFTKTDLCDDPVDDPLAFARSNAPALWRLCEVELERHRFFGSAVAGSVGTLVGRDGREQMVPLRVEPRGIVEPFLWLVSQSR